MRNRIEIIKIQNYFHSQHFIPDGSDEAVDHHVRQDQGDCHGGDVGCLSPHALLSILVEEECSGSHVRHHPVLRHDLVLHLLHPLRQGCCHQVLRWSHLIEKEYKIHKFKHYKCKSNVYTYNQLNVRPCSPNCDSLYSYEEIHSLF